MTENVYVNMGGPDLTKTVRYGRGEGEMEMEEGGEREERTEDIYLTPDDQDPIYATADDFKSGRQQDAAQKNAAQEQLGDDQDPIYVTADNLDSGTPQDAVQKNTAQEQLGGSEDSKQNRYIAAAACVGLCLLLLAGIIILVIFYCLLIKEKHNLQSSFDQLQSRLDNLTGLKDQCNTRFDKLLTRLNNMTEQNDQCKTSFDDLQTRHTNLTEDPSTRLCAVCESRGFTFGGGVCYHISTERKTWEESRTYCRDHQSDLMTIKSKEKQDLVDRVVGRVVTGTSWRMWLGLTDRDEKGVWKWVDGTPLTTPTYWRSGQPDDDGCAEYGYRRQFGWNDEQCSAIIHYICEIVV